MFLRNHIARNIEGHLSEALLSGIFSNMLMNVGGFNSLNNMLVSWGYHPKYLRKENIIQYSYLVYIRWFNPRVGCLDLCTKAVGSQWGLFPRLPGEGL